MAANNTKMNISYAIKAIDRFTRVHKRLERQLDSLKRQTEKLPDKTIDVKADTRQATRTLTRFERQLDKLNVDMELLSDYEVTPIFDGDQATKEISKIEKKLTRIRKEAEMELDVDTHKSKEQIERLRDTISGVDNMLKRLDKSKTTVAVRAMTERAEEKIEDVNRKLMLLPKVKTVYVNIKTNARKQLAAITNFQRDLADMGMNFAWGMLLAGLPPVIQGLTGALGAVASAAVPAALGIGGLAAVGIPALVELTDKYSDLKDAREELAKAKTEKEIAEATAKLAEITSDMSKEQIKAAEAMGKFGKFFDEFSAKFEPTILEGFTKSLETTQALLVILEPAIMSTANAVNRLIDSFRRNLETADMQKFFAWVGETAGPNIEKLTQAVGHFLAGFANMMVAFDPLAQGFLDWFLRLSESFRAWTSNLENNQAFQDFVKFCQENGPLLIEFFGNLIGAIWRLIEAASPFGMAVLDFVNYLLDLFNQTMDNNDGFKKLIGWLWVAISVFTAILGPIAIVGGILRTVLGPTIKLVGNLFGKFFTKNARKAGDTLTKNVDPKVNKSKGVFDKFRNMLDGPVFKAIGKVGTKLLRFLGPVGAVIGIVIELASVFGISWDDIWRFTESTWNKITGFLEGISLKTLGSNIMQGLLNGIKSVPIVGTFASIVSNGIKAAKKVLGIKSPSRVFMEIGAFTGEGMAIGLEKMTTRVQKASKAMVSSTVPNIESPTYGGVKVETTPNYRVRAQSVSSNPQTVSDENGRKYVVEVPIYLNKREIARAIAPDVTNEQEMRKRTANRFKGRVTNEL